MDTKCCIKRLVGRFADVDLTVIPGILRSNVNPHSSIDSRVNLEVRLTLVGFPAPVSVAQMRAFCVARFVSRGHCKEHFWGRFCINSGVMVPMAPVTYWRNL